MNKEEYKFDHFKNIDEVMYYFNYWYKEEDVYSINRYLSLKDFNYISNKYQELQKENKKQKEVIDKAIDLIEKSVTTDIGIDSNNNIIHYHQLTEDETSELLDILKEVE